MDDTNLDKKLFRLQKKFNNDLIYIDHSKIENAGFGVFSKNRIKNNTKLGEYIGKKYDNMDILNSKNKDTNYFFEVNDYKNKTKFILDAKYLKYSNFTRFINGVFSPQEYNNQNCRFYQNKGKIFVKTITDIEPNQELLIYYGDSYNL